MQIFSNEPLAPRTTLRVGGNANTLYEVHTEDELIALLTQFSATEDSFIILGAGSNVLIADDGIDHAVIAIRTRGIDKRPLNKETVEVRAQAGEPWDPFVSLCIAQGLAGVECLSGIPGLVGATPIQNVGAYGQQVSDCIQSVRCFDLAQRKIVNLSAHDCNFGYRHSLFKEAPPGHYVVLSVTFILRTSAPASPTYPGLQDLFHTERITSPTLDQIRTAVLKERRRKSMVIDRDDPNSRSVGSFFLNPILDPETFKHLCSHARTKGLLGPDEEPPHFVTDSTDSTGVNKIRVKIPAAWLIEKAGFTKGWQDGPAGISENHSLALVNLGHARAEDILRLANAILSRVQESFGISLVPEPTCLGFADNPFGNLS